MGLKKKKYRFVVTSMLLFICYIVQGTNSQEMETSFASGNPSIKKIEGQGETRKELTDSLELEIVTKQVEREYRKVIEIQFWIENIGQVPVSNILLYSKSQNYVTRIAMLYPGEKQVFTKGESEKLLYPIIEQSDTNLEISLYTEGVVKKDGQAIPVNKEKKKKITIDR